jgi:hypothetical protein
MRTIDALFAGRPRDVLTVAQGARRLIRRLLPDVEEVVDGSAPIVAYTRGAGYAGIVCTLMLSAGGVKLGLFRGSELPDPHGLLEGRGKLHGIRPLIQAADAASRARVKARAPSRRSNTPRS